MYGKISGNAGRPEFDLTRTQPGFAIVEHDPNKNSGHIGLTEFDTNLNFSKPYLKIQVGYGFRSLGRVSFTESSASIVEGPNAGPIVPNAPWVSLITYFDLVMPRH